MDDSQGLWKGSLLVSKLKNRVGGAGFAVFCAAVCLSVGCAPQQPVVNLYLDAVALRELGQDRLAIDRLNEVVKADPGFTLAYSELGKSYQKLGEHEKALAAFAQAAKLNPWSFEDHLNLAQTYDTLGKHAQAADVYARATELDPNSLDARAGAAGCYVKAGQYAKAEVYCEPTKQADDTSRRLLPVLALAYEGQKDYERAVEVYRKLLAFDDRDPNVLLSLGVACLKAERYEEARGILVSMAQTRPGDVAVSCHLGFCYLKLGDMDQAMLAYQKAVDVDGNAWEALRGLGVACMLKARQTGDDRWRDQALRHWRRSLEIKPDQPKRQELEKLIRENARRDTSLQGLSN